MNFSTSELLNDTTSLNDTDETSYWWYSQISLMGQAPANMRFEYQKHLEPVDYIAVNDFVNPQHHLLLPDYLYSNWFRYFRLATSFIAACYNLVFFIANIINDRMKSGVYKIRVFILLLSFTYCVNSVLFTFMFIFECLNEVSHEFAKMWLETSSDGEIPALWRIFADIVFQPLHDLTAVIFLCLAVDRYYSLYQSYRPFVKSRAQIVGMILIPVFVSCLMFNPFINHLLLPYEYLWSFRLTILMLPISLTVIIFSVCLIASRESYNYYPGSSKSIARFLVPHFLLFSILDLLGHIFFLARLAEDNIGFIILTGQEETDHIVHSFLSIGVQFSIFNTLLAPIYIPLVLSIFVQPFRRAVTDQKTF